MAIMMKLWTWKHLFASSQPCTLKVGLDGQLGAVRRLPVIQAVAVEVRQTTPSLLSQLLQKLRSNIQLLECLLIIGYLRRIGVFGEYEMRLQLVLDSHRWVPLPAVGFSATSISEDSQEDVTPPSYLME
ncbi:hypothetical protein Godav_007914 [Gossypium davidsonii]|uniref:Conserved oligomeric Golgi complex subunit 8 n=1 Tax=Gossypium davidsonii TaxID=34287 RepID=A0A7J8S9Z7_GOSDV|nr:hypothetical protein [Gossypium davidsonii]